MQITAEQLEDITQSIKENLSDIKPLTTEETQQAKQQAEEKYNTRELDYILSITRNIKNA